MKKLIDIFDKYSEYGKKIFGASASKVRNLQKQFGDQSINGLMQWAKKNEEQAEQSLYDCIQILNIREEQLEEVKK